MNPDPTAGRPRSSPRADDGGESPAARRRPPADTARHLTSPLHHTHTHPQCACALRPGDITVTLPPQCACALRPGDITESHPHGAM
ncbi:hypothetical protein chiPu_0022937, partial [Chiloscyllium punctatum]|nr:hypothetical protein [Chiloscyllium punctatum]